MPEIDWFYKGCDLDIVLVGLGADDRTIHYPEAVRKLIAFAIAAKPESLTGPEIHFLRKHLKLRRKELAKILGFSREDIDAFEQGEAFMSPDQEAGLRRSFFMITGRNPPPIDDLRTWAMTRGEETSVYRVDVSDSANYRLLPRD